MWIGTPEGLNRYDGFDFIIYKNIPGDSSSLAENVVQTIFEDKNMNLFIGMENSLCLYNRAKDNFLNYMLDKSSPLRGLNCIIADITQDTLGNLWLGTDIGLIYFDRINNSIIRYVHNSNDPESLSDNNVEDLLIDKHLRLWIATRRGLNLFQPESGSFRHFAGNHEVSGNFLNTIFMNLAEDNEGNIWVGSTTGLYCLKANSEKIPVDILHYQHDEMDKTSLSSDLIISLFIDNAGKLWIGTESAGINLFNKDNGTFVNYRSDDNDPQSLNNESIEAIAQDRSGNMWFGTYAGGLNVAIKNREAILKYQKLPGAPLSLSHNSVKCFLEDHQGTILIGTDGGGLNLFDQQTNRFHRLKMDNSNLSSDAILCLMEDSKNRIWLGTWAGGLVHFDSEKKSFKALTTTNSEIPDNSIYALAEGEDNDLWLGSFEHGLIHYQIKNGKFIGYNPENSGLANKMIVKLVKLSNHRILIGTINCLQIYSINDNHFTTYLSDQNNTNSLSYPRVTDILVENDTSIWIGTPDGLNRFNPVTGSFERFYEKDGLPHNFIKGLIFDKSGSLWVTTSSGACRFDYKKRIYNNFTTEDGLQGKEFSERGVYKTKNGAVLLGGTRGFNVVYPEKISKNKFIPDVLITDLKIFNRSAVPGAENSPLVNNITETKILTVTNKMSILTFFFAAMDFTAIEKNQYAYWMEGFDNDWVYSGNKREATYTNLNPGKYIFHVKGSNNDGVWNNEGISIQVIVLPPWYAQWWIQVISVLLLIFIFISIFISRVRHLNNQKILLEKLVAVKTSELYELNASKDKFFSIIAHDLKNPFNNIIGFSGLLQEEIRSGDHERNKLYADSINNSAVQTLSLLDNLLEWAKSQTGKTLYNPQPVQLNELINEECTMLTELAKSKNIEFKRSFPDNLTIMADRNMIKTVLRNLISNAIKFTHKNGKIEVKAIADHQKVEISVIDSGMGMSGDTIARLFKIDSDLSTPGTENEKGTGLGLVLCKEFIEKHGSMLLVESELAKGSIFRFSLPLIIT
jgi:signal transduction histidine kinase/ligand-binding sensor domain-containing protein